MLGHCGTLWGAPPRAHRPGDTGGTPHPRPAPSPAAPAPGGGSVPAAERGPTAALKYGSGKSPTAPCVAFYLNNILSWMTSLYNVV